MEKGLRSRAVLRIVWGFAAGLIAVGATAFPAASAKEDITFVGTMPIRFPKGVARDPVQASIILNSPLRRGYQFFFNSQTRDTVGRVVDLDSHRVIVERVLPREYFPSGPYTPSQPQLAGEWVHTVNPETGDLYIGAGNDNDPTVGFAGIARLNPLTLEVVSFFPYEQFTYEPNVNVDPGDPENAELPCVAANCLPQNPTVRPQLRGLSFAPTVLTGVTNKLLLIMQEDNAIPPVNQNVNVPWLAQWDAETGHQDWMSRVTSCSTSELPGRDGSGFYNLGIFQARLGAGIYLGCQGSGATGVVVRVPTDGSNQPIPNAEQAYPGPQSVVDAIPDPDSDRMILRVQNEDGDSFWVFDGTSNSYTGVIGGTLARVTAVAAGIDPTSGRFYMLAPPTGKGRQSSEGGLLISDIRRSPAPQFLSFEDYAGQWQGAIRVDVHPTTGERLIYAVRKEADEFTILRDSVPISQDPPVQDRDRLTIDVEEEAGETGRNFTGAGHAYGLRVLLAGGVEGFPPTGPDFGGFRIGRYGPLMAGSPCGPGDRELVIASVDQAGLSNNLSNAGASVGSADAGTRTDMGEATARCYPRPRDTNGDDIWTRDNPVMIGKLEDRLGEYPQPHRTELDDEETSSSPNEPKTDLDELLGSEWPYAPTQCSGDAQDSTTTKLRPLNRGDTETGPFTDEQRATEIPLDRWTASVECDQKNARVFAKAEILAHEETAPALDVDVPDLGKIRVAEVSSTTLIYLDKERGLVSRSVAMARGIQLGENIFIDATFGIAEAWAAGRPGTAGTDYQRYICGVRVKDQAPDTHVYLPNPFVQTPPTDDPTAWDPMTAVDPNLEGGGEVNKGVAKSTCGDPDESAFGTFKPYGIDDQQPVIDVINRVLGNRGRLSAPKPDGTLSQGTPGGYLASIQKDRLNEISARAVNNDPSTQVPALELVIFNDDRNQGRGRQLYQFAGVDASVTYGIYLLNPAEMIDPGCEPYCVEEEIDKLFPPVAPEPVVPTGDPPPAQPGPVTLLFDGVNFLLRAPKDALLAAAVWAILFAPIQLSSRRRALRRLA